MDASIPFYKKRWVQIVAGVFVLAAIFGETSETSSNVPETATPAPAAPSVPEPAPAEDAAAPVPARPTPQEARAPAIPPDQTAFLALIADFEQQYKAAATDLQRANVRNLRRAALCDLIPDRQVTDWVGTVATIGGNSDGDAYLDLDVGPNVNIGTWNNRVSDLFDGTMIRPTDPKYDLLLELTKGDRVLFSGTFLSSANECIRTANLTETFDMSRPDFKFFFSRVDRG
jgi:hypothetical protein